MNTSIPYLGTLLKHSLMLEMRLQPPRHRHVDTDWVVIISKSLEVNSSILSYCNYGDILEFVQPPLIIPFTYDESSWQFFLLARRILLPHTITINHGYLHIHQNTVTASWILGEELHYTYPPGQWSSRKVIVNTINISILESTSSSENAFQCNKPNRILSTHRVQSKSF